MNIALIGYGKMGKAIEAIALQRRHHVVLKIGSHNANDFTAESIRKADVAIEFSAPDVAKENVLKCLNAGVPVVSGTTGWQNEIETAKLACSKNNTAFIHASNFSIGVNIFFEVNKLLASLMSKQEDYDVTIEEVHHTEKKDAPSGTAITIAEQILQELKRKKGWVVNNMNEPEALPIMAHRIDSVPGTHAISYHSAIDKIEIIHTAHTREGFAKGAVQAAEFIAGKKGVFEMKDVLGIET